MVPSASAITVNKIPDEGILLEMKASLNQQQGVLAAWNATTKFYTGQVSVAALSIRTG